MFFMAENTPDSSVGRRLITADSVAVRLLHLAAVLASWLVLASLNRLLMRAVLRWMRSRGWNQQTAVIVGTGRLAQKLYYTLTRHLWTGIDPQYFIGESAEPGRLYQTDLLGPIEQIDRIIVLTYSPQHGWSLLLKRVLDIVTSTAAITLAALPMLIITLLVKLGSRGPVFYRQVRASLGGEAFKIVKFRTMKHNGPDESDAAPTEPRDPRVTPIGRWLRRTSLDKLP